MTTGLTETHVDGLVALTAAWQALGAELAVQADLQSVLGLCNTIHTGIISLF